jgi:hypothetical protein
VEITISAGDDSQALEQFYHWLRDDVDVVRSATPRLTAAQDAGRMGAFEVISMAIGNATALGSLAVSLANFRRSRKDPPPITITIVGAVSAEQLDEFRKLNLPLGPGDD